MPILVNGETIEDSVVRDEMAAIRPRYEEAMGDMDPIAREIQLKEWSRDTVIERVLLRQEAMKDATLVSPEDVSPEDAGAEGAEPEVDIETRVQRLLEKVASKAQKPRHKDIGDYYRKNKERFMMPEMIHAAHIVKNVDENTTEEQALAAITEAKAELDAGADFRELADRHSDCAGNGGDLGYFSRGEMVEEFENVAFALEPNQTSDIFRTVFGFHILRVLDRKAAGAADLTEVSGHIENALMEEKRQRILEEYLDDLRAKADVQIQKAGSV